MADYQYRVRNRQGNISRGVIKASSEEEAVEMLGQHGLVPIEIRDSKDTSFFSKELTLKNVSVRDRAIFSRQLATMISSGIPILQALRILVSQTENSKLADILREATYDIEGGESLSNALEKYPHQFSEFFISMVRSGEQSGRVAEALERLADNEERNYSLISKVRGALIYPAFVISAMLVMGLLMVVFVIPQLTGLFDQSDVELPFITKVLMGSSTVIGTYWWFILLFIIVAGVLISFYVRTTEGRYNMHAIMLRLPIAGRLLQKMYLAQFTGAMEVLVKSEIPVVQALMVARDIMGNKIYRQIIDETAEEVKNGSTISSAFEKYPEIPMMVSQMISVGERSGELGKSLSSVNRFYQREVNDAVQNITQLIEPVVIVVLGVGVAVMIMAVLMPIYQLVNVIQ
ncbi:MAG: type II secretion system F family protein [bacterium]|nr:type II secretion system F family protein [bacterium]